MNVSTADASRRLIAVIGDASLTPDSPKYKLAEECGHFLVDHHYRLITGGLGGVMEAACKGARISALYREGATVGLLPGFDPAEANPFVDVVIPTGLDLGRNVIVANADAVIAIGGGAGTLAEIANAWQLKRLIIAFRVHGWSGKLADTRVDERRRYAELKEDKVYGVDTPCEMVKLLDELLPLYTKHHQGIRRRSEYGKGHYEEAQ